VTDGEVSTAVAAGRRAIADLLESLDEQQFATPSLCAGWDVRTVGAHLAESAAPELRATLAAMVRARGRLHQANDESSRRAARRPVAETVALLRWRADSHFTPPIRGPRAPLTELLVHEGDMRLPLDLAYDPGRSAVRTALDFVTTGRPIGFVSRGRPHGLRLVATDLDWSWGAGPSTSGRGIDPLIAACGRAPVMDRLDGRGAHQLRQRGGGSGR
jgi:uncharacterized protein (TIGR03083 family)